ncbi:hypothetical protein EhV317 [Emiliania huxleyi virus 86]|uniref:Uncharacterized protein n=1 Tax=Emiliania huxleyi virus 86 (isolate United Kingdom/English Channel/1999) TaxID=654925 RepID=Q4A2G2_EHV8U|nr:hypothetical protein EhV317 [Emiliania huxleyi virus 86]AEO97768.1 hypothetical protein ENVG_00235 [Emiliania huxleyi virus 84]AEO98466.1 hypothetical protein ELVG_00165 [Emiliania huxleyi virus 203]AEP15246.1 hypothetical protein EOVG_00309 [Emiliania huxleyi virus 88]AEP15859.1 hypothetical protein EQVG_00451 [Emiliania huxleyi virus 207]AEP16311.1 hypothetical protein ERVG_00438 [Emiliania huxleyi virus 208]AET98026.1 hypothetical protein EPVG_00138 [Emiliania huxleyi virus 201]AHA5492
MTNTTQIRVGDLIQCTVSQNLGHVFIGRVSEINADRYMKLRGFIGQIGVHQVLRVNGVLIK